MRKIRLFNKEKANREEGETNLGIKSLGLQGFFEHFRELEDIYAQRRHEKFRGLLKDMEIQAEEYIMVSLIFSSIALIISLTLDFAVVRIDLTDTSTFIFLVSGVIIGSLIGAIFSGIVTDIVRKRLKLIQVLLIIAIIDVILEIIFITPNGILLNFFFICTTSFIVTTLFLLQTTLFLEYSTVLGRGRILTFIYVEMLLFLVVFSVITHIGIMYFPPLTYSSFFFIGFAIIFIHREKKLEKPPIKGMKLEERHMNVGVVKILFFIFFFSFTLGLATPIYELKSTLIGIFSTQDANFSIFMFFGFIFLFTIISTIIVGFVFDFKGRLITISSLIVIITIVNFSSLFEAPLLYLHEMTIISLYVAAVMTISLLIGDVTKRKNFGKTITLAMTIGVSGLLIGLEIVIGLRKFIVDTSYSSILLLGIQYLASVITLILLMLSKETLPLKEKEWYESLIHFYVIHKSGLLLYEHEFTKVKERAESDLVSGGIIGLTTILGEIVKGKEKLRTIDHGDKKLMFKYSPDKDVIFVLLIGEDLFVLRNKLNLFILEFTDEYQERVENLQGVVASQWVGVSKLIDKHFSTKYFEVPYERRPKHLYRDRKGNE